MSRVLVIGCGGVASVAIQKCCQADEVFTELCIASRTKEKCDALAEKLKGKTKTVLTTAKVDADDVDQLIELINDYKPDLVMNIALPYQDLTIMDACLACGVNYMDTANYEPEDTDDPKWRAIYEKRCKEEGFSAYFDYSWQWAYRKKFEDAGLTALLGCGFDPGVTQAYCAYALKHEFDQIDTIDILDCNGGDHGYAFATNFNPEGKHFGVDLTASPNESIVAALDGTVILATYTADAGYVVQIQHTQNFVTVYKHCGSLMKTEGDKVKGGEVIALVGKSGNEKDTPHLHFEVWHKGNPVNPAKYVVF